MTVAGTLIGQMTSDACIVGIGQCLGRGTIISIFLVLFVLPQILLVGGKLVDKTSFSMHHVVLHTNTASGPGACQWHGAGRGERLRGRYHERHCGWKRTSYRSFW